MFLTNGKDYFSVEDAEQIKLLRAKGYIEIDAIELAELKAKALASYVQQSDPKNTK